MNVLQKSTRRGLLGVLLGLVAGTTFAQQPAPRSPWEGFGTFELILPAKEGLRAARMLRYANGELMFEADQKRMLVVRASGIELYAGLAEDEGFDFSGKAFPKSPFLHFGYAFSPAGMALHQGYPSGLASVPSEITEIEVLLEQRKAKLRTQRLSPGEVQFRLTLTLGTATQEMNGTWLAGPLPALPDDFPLRGWRSRNPAGFATLGAARAFKAQAPAATPAR